MRLTFPDQPAVSSQCRNLIRKLLTKNERKRLGSQHGASDVKQHPFFAGITWSRTLAVVPPRSAMLFEH